MAEATATAPRGHVRSRQSAGTMSRDCWRLVVLLGLAWTALLLLGGTAHASPASAPADDRADDRAAAGPQVLPLVGRVLARVEGATAALPRLADAPEDLGTVVPASQPTTATTTATTTEPTTEPALPALGTTEAVTAVANAVRATATATASGDELLAVRLPSVEATASPVVLGVAERADATVRNLTAAATVLAARIPVARPLTRPLGGVLSGAATTVDRTTDALVATSTRLTGTVDTLVDRTTVALAPVLSVVTGPAGAITVGGPGAAPQAPTEAGPTTGPATGAATGAPGAAGPGAAVSAATGRADGMARTVTGGPVVPPPDAVTDAVAQPAPDTVTTAPVPVSAAGSTTGNPGSAPSPRLDQTLVRVDESEPAFAAAATEPIEGPTGPMPGTPAADPAFSPD